MKLVEYRIPLPYTTEEYQIGQLYSFAVLSKEESGDGEGVEVIKNEPFEDENGKGQYTYKIYHVNKRLPAWLAKIIPNSSLTFHEEAWNAYPYCKTVVTSPFFGKKFRIELTTRHVPDDCGQLDNVHDLSSELLKKRKVVLVDIVNDSHEQCKKEEHPSNVHSPKLLQRLGSSLSSSSSLDQSNSSPSTTDNTNSNNNNNNVNNHENSRNENSTNNNNENASTTNTTTNGNHIRNNSSSGSSGNGNNNNTGVSSPLPLRGADWYKDTLFKENSRIMCAYKLVSVECKLAIVQSAIESKLHDTQKGLLLRLHQKMHFTVDDWLDLTMDEIRRLENEIKEELRQKFEQKEAEKAAAKSNKRSFLSSKSS